MKKIYFWRVDGLLVQYLEQKTGFTDDPIALISLVVGFDVSGLGLLEAEKDFEGSVSKYGRDVRFRFFADDFGTFVVEFRLHHGTVWFRFDNATISDDAMKGLFRQTIQKKLANGKIDAMSFIFDEGGPKIVEKILELAKEDWLKNNPDSVKG